MYQRRIGFTLIELLIVIAIISILAAILFPVFAQAREKARTVVCLSNQKNIGTGIQMYLQDYNERMFVNISKTSPSISRSGVVLKVELDVANSRWWNVLMPYLKNRKVLVCPSDDLPTPSEDPKDKLTILRSYFPSRATEDLLLAQVMHPAEAIVITEKWGHYIGDPNKITGELWMEPTFGHLRYWPQADWMEVAANRHHGGIICTFFDGHAKWFKPRTLDASKTLTGCDLIHTYPLVSYGVCDSTVAGCTNLDPNINICNSPSFTYP